MAHKILTTSLLRNLHAAMVQPYKVNTRGSSTGQDTVQGQLQGGVQVNKKQFQVQRPEILQRFSQIYQMSIFSNI